MVALIPTKRYIHWMFESPLVHRYPGIASLASLRTFFNWSMSYRADSHFPVPYGRLTKVAQVTLYPW